jgi:hypothetical protein
LIIYPAVSLEVEMLMSELPGYLGTIQEWLTPLVKRVSQMDPGRIQDLLQQVLRRFEGLPLQILGTISVVLGRTLVSLTGVLTLR